MELDPAGGADDAKWFHAMAWQGGGSRLVALDEIAPGTYRTAEPIPVHGDWKSMIRLHKGSAILAMPVYMPGDAAIPAKEVPAARASNARSSSTTRSCAARSAAPRPGSPAPPTASSPSSRSPGWLAIGAAVTRFERRARAGPRVTLQPGDRPRVLGGMRRILIITATLAALRRAAERRGGRQDKQGGQAGGQEGVP